MFAKGGQMTPTPLNAKMEYVTDIMDVSSKNGVCFTKWGIMRGECSGLPG